MTRRVAIIGAASRFPGTTQATLWDDLLAGKDMVTEVADDRWSKESLSHPDKKAPGMSYSFAAGSLGDITGFDPAFFGISPREAASMDPQQRMLLEMSWEAIEHAGIPAEKMRGSRCGVFMGIASLDYSYRMADDLSAIGPNTATGNTSSVASNRLSYAFDLHGPSLSLDTACSSSLVAFHQACQSIRSGETDMALTGGISLHLHPYGFLIFSKATMLSKTGRCQVFDEAGDGYARSEGGGVFLLKDLDQAIADGDRILAVVASSVVNTDGYKSGLTVPNPAAQIQLMEQACEQAGITPDEIDYLEAHGTGTAVGDPLETRAIGAAIGQKRTSPLPIGSIKSNMGHLETASGVAGLAKALGVITHREVPATIKIQRLNPKIRTDEWNLDIVTQSRKLKTEGRLVVGVNSFGFGGANAHVLLESAPEQSVAQPNTEGEQTPPLRLSARSPQALKQSALELAEHLRELAAHDMAPSLYDLAWQLAARREHHVHGALLNADNFTTLLEDLDTLGSEGDLGDHPRITLADRLPPLPSASDNGASPRHGANAVSSVQQERGPVFVYSGNGCQWAGMGRALMEESASVRACLERLDVAFRDFNGFELLKELDGSLSEKGENRMDATEIAQPTLFALQVAVTEWLIERGIRPAAVTGHSVGEVAAAWASGALTLEQATRVIFQRSYHQGRTRGTGAMMAVGLGECEMREWLEQPQWASLSLAGINGPRGTTLAGERELLEALSKELSAQGTFARVLGLDYAFHSPAMDPIKSGLLESLDGLTPRATHTPFISTVTGSVIAGEQLDARYWWENIRQPVMFEAAITSLVNWHADIEERVDSEESATLGRHRLLVEIGAHPILRSYLNDILKARSDEAPAGQVLASLDRRHAGVDALEHLRGRVLLSGAVDITGLFPVAGQFVELPSYPWQRIPCWIQTTSESQRLLDRHYVHPLLGYRLAQQRLTWEAQLDTQKVAWLADHQVGESAVFPGAGYLEQCLAAAHEWQVASADPDSLPDVLDLEDFEIRAPLLLDDSTLRLTRLSLDSANGAMRLESRETRAEDADKWNLHAVARAFTATRGRLLERAAPVMPTRAADFGRDEHVAVAAQLGLHYGPHFRAAEQIWVDAGNEHHALGTARPQVLARFSLTEEMASQDADFHLHPGVLDSAFQLFIPLLGVLKGQMAASNGMAFVPVRVGRLQVREQVRASQIVTARVVLRSRGPHSLCADFELFDAEGRAVAVAEEARFRAVRLGRDGTAHLDYLDIELTAAPHPLTQPSAPALDLAGLVNDAMQATEAADDGEDGDANIGENIAESNAATSAQALLADSQCFRDELEPLLDSLMLSSVHETLLRHAAPGDPELAHLDHEALSRWQRRCPLFSRALLDWAESQGLTEALDSGDWRINSLDLPAANDIWQLLVRDYPGQFPLTHAAGRLHLHLDEWLNRGMPLQGATDEAAADGEVLLSTDAAAALDSLRQPLIPTLLKTAVGNAGWQWLSAQLDQRISSALGALPAGQRLAVLELGAGGPWLGQRLAALREADARNGRYTKLDYRFVAASAGALSEASRLQDELPLIDVIAGEAFQDTATTRKAQLAIVHLDFEAPSQARELLTALIANLAPSAQLLLCGCEPAAWTSSILALDDGEQLRSHPGSVQWQRLLTQLGLVIETPAPASDSLASDHLGTETSGAWWLSATLATQAPLAALAKPAEDQTAASESVESEAVAGLASESQAATLSIALLDSPQAPADKALLTRLSDSLTARGHQVSHQRLSASLPADMSALIEQLGDIDHLIALPSAAATAGQNGADHTNALQCSRQQLLTQVAQAFDSAQEQDDSRVAPTLWVLTHDVATLWQTDGAPAATPPADAASWGFARSLANESQSLAIRLLDTPTLEHDAVSMPALMGALVQELEAPDHEQEVVLNATGARFATRLRQVTAPQQAAGGESARLQISGSQTSASKTPGAQRHGVSLGFSQPGQLRNLEWQPRILPAVAAGEVEVRVEATGLNFRDVMYTLGLLSDEAIEHGFSGPSLGLEFSGIVTQAGANAEFKVGERVVGFGPASFSDRLVIADTALAHVPHGVSLEAAATIPTTFFTVYYALKHLARLEEGEKVLIHGAAGGVGIAALQIAEWLGAEVFATVGSPTKRDFLALMGIDNVYDSRSHGFAEDILADLAARQQRDPSVDARGVDVVLNSLAGEAIAQNLRVLKPFGRFCELGKRDFYENTPMGLRPFRNNLSYFGIDSDQLMKECPGLTTRLFREMMALFEDGTLAPLPYTTFDASQVVEAFRYMQQARQIGKVVVTQRAAEHAAEQTSAGAGASAVSRQSDALTANAKKLTIDPAGSYLVTGGLGGFGLRSAEWLAAQGARELVLLGRSGAASEEAQHGVARLEAQGVNVHALACDVADEDALSEVFERFGKPAEDDGIAPLKGIIHAAAVIDDALIRHLDAERIQRVMTPKLEGARLLDRLSAEHALDFFVLYSSATTLFGNPGQSVYVAANHWLEGLAAHRRARGLPATCARWGAIEDVGFLARNEKTREALKNRLGGDALMADHALACLGEMIVTDQQALALGKPGRSLGVLELEWGALARFLPTAATPRFDEIARRAGDDDGSQAQQDDIAAALAGLSGEALQTAIVEILKGELSKILLIDVAAIDINKSVYDMGFDSLMGVELMTAVEARLGISIPVMMISEAATLWRLAERLMHKMSAADGEDAESSSEDQAMAQLVKQHGGEAIPQGERGEMVSK